MEFPTLFKVLVLMALSLFSQSRQGSSLFLGNHRKYNAGDSLSMEVASLVSFMHSPLSYYSLPFCKPQEGVKDTTSLNLGRLLVGDRAQNSPYRIKMNDNGTAVFLCQSNPLSADEVDLWKKRINEMYYIKFILDDLPARRYIKSQLFAFKSLGFEVGSHFFESYYVFNHLEFKVLVHKEENINIVTDGNENGGSGGAPLYTVVGFEVTPCSVRHDDHLASNLTMYDKYPYSIWGSCIVESKEIKETELITFTYTVTFEESDINWKSIWDVYPLMYESDVQAPSLINSAITTAVFFVYILINFRRRTRQKQVRAGTTDAKANAPLIQKSYGPCKLEDVFRAPDCPMLLCAATGTGVQILGMAVVTMMLAALGFLSSAPRGTLVMLMVFLYTFFGVAAGFAASCLWRKLGCTHPIGWIPVSLRVACMFPIIALLSLASKSFLLGTINYADIETETTTSIYLLAIMIVLWLGISLPLTLIGGCIGSKPHHKDTSPATVKTPDENIPQASTFRSLLFFALAGVVSFSLLNIQLSYILSCLRTGYMYDDYWFLCIVTAHLLVVCSESSIIFVDKCLLIGDSRWWWKSFFAAASVAVYLFAYLIYNLVYHDLQFTSGPGSVAVYIGYIVLISLATMLATGAAGLLSTFWFLHYVFSK